MRGYCEPPLTGGTVDSLHFMLECRFSPRIHSQFVWPVSCSFPEGAVEEEET
jgi:hypothetical protein